MVERICEMCNKPVSGKMFECVIFTDPRADDRRLTEKDITSYRCYPCDDKETDKMLWL